MSFPTTAASRAGVPCSLGPKSRRGFALIVTIVLVAFLVLIVVGLATFTRVETQVAENSQNLAAARQNALFALNVALGELQRTTGPDQRVTVTADIGTVGDGDATTPDNGLPAATDGTYPWTGALGNAANPVNPLDARKAAHTGETPALLNWLVSGNEGARFTASVAAANFGQITATPPVSGAGAIRFTPAAAITGLGAATTTATALTITAADGTVRDAALLVGPGSAANSVDPAAPQANYVVAPLVDIQALTASVPGLGSAAGNTTIGRYAWWVGDEGVKARINLDDPNKAATTGDAARLRTLVAARTGTEVVTGFDAVNPNAPTTTLARVITNNQAAFLPGVTQDEVKARFHDITPHSMGVLANVATGGLKKDLTAGLLDSTQPDEIADDEPLFTTPTGAAVTTGTISETAAARYGALTQTERDALRTPKWSGEAPSAWPNWAKIRSYVQLQNQLSGDGASMDPRQASDTQHGVHPIITRLQLYVVPFVDRSQNDIRITYLPVVVLWNPYNVTLTGQPYAVWYEHDYTAFTGHIQSGNPSNTRPPTWPSSSANHYNDGSGEPQWPVVTAIHGPAAMTAADLADPTKRADLKASRAGSAYMGRNGFRFVIDCPDIPPGRALVFTPGANRELSSDPTNNILEVGYRNTGFYERANLGVPGDRSIFYTMIAWPRDIVRHQRFAIGLGGTFNGRVPDNLLQVVSGINSRENDDLNSNTVRVEGRLIDIADKDPGSGVSYDYSAINHIEGVLPLPGGSDAYFVTNRVGTTPGVEDSNYFTVHPWKSSWDSTSPPAEIDNIWPSAAVPGAPSSKTLGFVFRMDFPFFHKDAAGFTVASANAHWDRNGRWLANYDPTAPRIGHSYVEGGRSDSGPGGGHGGNPLFPPHGIAHRHLEEYSRPGGSQDPKAYFVDTTGDDFEFAHVGASHSLVTGGITPADSMILKHLPRRGAGVLSLGGLQHANLHPTAGQLRVPFSYSDQPAVRGYSSSHMPIYAVGNSLADPLVNPADIDGFPNAINSIAAAGNLNFTTGNSGNRVQGEAFWQRIHFDLSLLANRALWDRYFFSAVPRSGTGTADRSSLNPRLVWHDPAGLLASGAATAVNSLRDFDSAASSLLVNGAFNVNSVSVEAWRAVLASLRNAPVANASVPADRSALPRTNYTTADALDPVGNERDIAAGDRFRALTDQQIDELAAEVVDEIRRRGPAVTLAGFVNRKPQAEGDEQAGYPTVTDAPAAMTTTGVLSEPNRVERLRGFQRYLGPLQLAIDRVSAFSATTGDITSTATGINDGLMLQSQLDSSFSQFWQGAYYYNRHVSRVAMGGHREITGNGTVSTTGVNHIIADAPVALRSRAFGLPGYLTQADILQALGSTISVRSDTFRVRTYGEVRNPATGDVSGRAWAEAVVQRLPVWVNESDSPEKWRPNLSSAGANSWDPSDATNGMKPENLQFGRRYRVVSFRWLNPEDV